MEDRHPHEEITIGSFFRAFVSFIKWCAIIGAFSYGFLWLLVPTFRHNVRNVEGPGPKPTDCDFMTAPLGNKGCHYDMQRVLVDTQGNYIATVSWSNSRTDGKPGDSSAKPDTMVCSWVRVQEVESAP